MTGAFIQMTGPKDRKVMQVKVCRVYSLMQNPQSEYCEIPQPAVSMFCKT